MDNLRDYITTIETGKRPTGGAESSGVPSLSAEHMDKDGHLHFGSSKMKYVSEDYYETLKTGKLRDGDIVLVKDGATTGKVAFVDEVPVDKACINEHCYILRANENLLNEYLFFYLFSPIGNARVLDSYKGATIGGIGKSFIDMPILVPSLEKQKQIVSILRKQRHIIALYNRQLKSLDSLIKSRFVELFGDINSNNKAWRCQPLGELCTIVRGGSPRPIESFLGGDVPWIKIGDATAGDSIYIYSTKEHIIQDGVKKSRLIKAGSLIFANCGVSLGFARIITFDGCIHDGWLAMEDIDEKINKVFLLHSLNQMTDYFRETAPSGTQPNLNTAIMKSYQQIIPPLELQEKFVESIDKINKSKSVIQKSLDEAQLLFDSLMQEYFG